MRLESSRPRARRRTLPLRLLVVILLLFCAQQLHALPSVCPPPLPPCESRSFATNITVQIDFESPRQGAVLGKEGRVRLSVVLHDAERPAFEAMLEQVVICLRLDGGPADCRPFDKAQSFRLTNLSPGPHCLSAWAQDLYQRRLGYGLDSTSEFSVLDVAGEMERARQRGPHSLDIVTPDNHTVASAAADFLPLTVEGVLACNGGQGCSPSWPTRLVLEVQDEQGRPMPQGSFDAPLVFVSGDLSSAEAYIRASVHVPLGAVLPGPGFFRVRASIQDPTPLQPEQQAPRIFSAPLLLYRQLPAGPAPTTTAPAPAPPQHPPPPGLVVVTAADEPYVDRLRNLVGSLHLWEPHTPLLVYDLGLSTFTRETVQAWANVRLLDLPWSQLPDHFRQARLCAFKPLVVLHALQAHARVIWLDANFELRRPLSSITSLMDEQQQGQGSFLTISGHLFPTDKVVRPATLSAMHCPAPFASRLEATSAVMGVDRGSSLATHVLPAMHRCALDLVGCHFPADATFENQRRDQSSLNAALCALQVAHERDPASWPAPPPVYPDKRFWMWADQATYPPPPDPERFGDMALFSRRGKPPNPYQRHVQSKRLVVEQGDDSQRWGAALLLGKGDDATAAEA